MAAYRDEVDEMAKSFLGYDIKHIRREDNMAADTLSKLGSARQSRQAYSSSTCMYHRSRWWIQKIRN
jgi:hypothetical protein